MEWSPHNQNSDTGNRLIVIAILEGGPSGLTAALLLAKRGHQVTIDEKAPYFTASLESAIQAGNAAATALDKHVLQLPT